MDTQGCDPTIHRAHHVETFGESVVVMTGTRVAAPGLTRKSEMLKDRWFMETPTLGNATCG